MQLHTHSSCAHSHVIHPSGLYLYPPGHALAHIGCGPRHLGLVPAAEALVSTGSTGLQSHVIHPSSL